MSKSQGNHLKEITVDFVANNSISIENAEAFLRRLTKVINMEIVHIEKNKLSPGWDILVTIKESCIYFGYWGEYNYCHLIISSCKEYDTRSVISLIKDFFEAKPKVKLIRNMSIKKILKELE